MYLGLFSPTSITIEPNAVSVAIESSIFARTLSLYTHYLPPTLEKRPELTPEFCPDFYSPFVLPSTIPGLLSSYWGLTSPLLLSTLQKVKIGRESNL